MITFKDVLVPSFRFAPEVVESEMNAGAVAPDNLDTEESVADQLSALLPAFDTVRGNCVFSPGMVTFMVDGDTVRRDDGPTEITPVLAGPSMNLTRIV
jgi:hypothetical protein